MTTLIKTQKSTASLLAVRQGFRKVDHEQWEFANEDFLRGQRHLLKNIHRRKPIHSHSPQNQAAATLTDGERRELEDEIQSLKREKNALVLETQRCAQQLHGVELQTQSLAARLQQVELHHRQIITFLNLVIQRGSSGSGAALLPLSPSPEEDHGKKKRRLLWLDGEDDGGAVGSSRRVFDSGPFDRMESLLDSLEGFVLAVGRASGMEMGDGAAATLAGTPSMVILMKMNASPGDTDGERRLRSPMPHSFPPLDQLSDNRRSWTPEMAESPPRGRGRSTASEIDINSDPTPAEGPLTGVNDMFWEQFLTETPGQTDDSGRKSVDCDTAQPVELKS